MKRLTKFLLVIVAALLFFLNFNLSIQGKQVDKINLSFDSKTALTDDYSSKTCYYDADGSYCWCDLYFYSTCSTQICQNWVSRCHVEGT